MSTDASISVVCPQCGKQAKAPAAAIGKNVTCRCGAKFLVEPDKAESRDSPPLPTPTIESVSNDTKDADYRNPLPELATTSDSRLIHCSDCNQRCSMNAVTCPGCGAPLNPERRLLITGAELDVSVGGALVMAGGVAMTGYFALLYRPTTGGDVLNLGLLNTQLIGVIIGVGLTLAGLRPTNVSFKYEWVSQPKKRGLLGKLFSRRF
jgi:hypothetical protein